MNILAMLWSKTAAIAVGAVGLLVALLGLRHSIRKGAKEELSNEIKTRTIERVDVARKVERDVDSYSHDDIADSLRNNGWLRD